MAKLPPPHSATVAAIYAAYEAGQTPYHSYGLSISTLGEECARRLWYGFRWAYAPERKEGRILRIFELGEREETDMLDALRKIGCVVEGEQERVRLCGGHLRGKIDGKVTGLPEAPKTQHIVECKSHSDKNFKTLDLGVARAKHAHHVQIQMYMGYFGTPRGLYMAVNKNDSSLLTERVEFDAMLYAQMIAKAERIIYAARPPERLHKNPPSKAAWLCNYCPAFGLCHGGKIPPRNCRTCLHSTPVSTGDGEWRCDLSGLAIDRDKQALGCKSHLYIPDLVPAEQIDASEADNTVTYRLPSGETWVDDGGAFPAVTA
jgi:hypothetical protein